MGSEKRQNSTWMITNLKYSSSSRSCCSLGAVACSAAATSSIGNPSSSLSMITPCSGHLKWCASKHIEFSERRATHLRKSILGQSFPFESLALQRRSALWGSPIHVITRTSPMPISFSLTPGLNHVLHGWFGRAELPSAKEIRVY